MIETTCWFGQSVLLAETGAMDRIAAAIGRIQKHADQIANT